MENFLFKLQNARGIIPKRTGRITKLEGVFSSAQFSSVAQSCPTLCDPMNRSTPDLPVHHQLLEFTQTHIHWVGDAIQPSHPLSSPSPPAPNPSQHQSLSSESTLRTRWPKYWSFSFTIIHSKEYPGLISFRMDWLDLLAVQGTLKSLLKHHSSKASILLHSAFFICVVLTLINVVGISLFIRTEEFMSLWQRCWEGCYIMYMCLEIVKHYSAVNFYYFCHSWCRGESTRGDSRGRDKSGCE